MRKNWKGWHASAGSPFDVYAYCAVLFSTLKWNKSSSSDGAAGKILGYGGDGDDDRDALFTSRRMMIKKKRIGEGRSVKSSHEEGNLSHEQEIGAPQLHLARHIQTRPSDFFC